VARELQEAYSSGLDGLARALQNWQDARQGRRKGAKVGFPRRKRKGRCGCCGLVTDRDLNAARNLAALVDALTNANPPVVAGSGPETLETPVDGGVRPGSGRAVPGEAGSRRQTVRSG
jgi:transposase